jgi:hypothetical protein
MAALGQVAYLAQWPLYVAGVAVPRWPAAAVALVRMGIYAGLGWGLLWGERRAWLGVFLETGRTLAFFAGPLLLRDASLVSPVFPAAWLQGLLTGALPFVITANTALAAGWSPGGDVEPAAAFVIRLLAAWLGISALWLRRQERWFKGAARLTWREVLRDGLPPVLVLSAVEGTAALLALRATAA